MYLALRLPNDTLLFHSESYLIGSLKIAGNLVMTFIKGYCRHHHCRPELSLLSFTIRIRQPSSPHYESVTICHNNTKCVIQNFLLYHPKSQQLSRCLTNNFLDVICMPLYIPLS
jgi:hypothetical protein